MLIQALDADILARAEQLSGEVAAKLAAARGTRFDSEAAAEAALWEVIALLQQQAAITARILTTAIDVRTRARAEQDQL